MNAPTSSSAPAEKLLSSVEAEISKLVEQKIPNPPTQVESDADRIRSSIARLTSTSIDGLEGLMSEVQQLQTFLKSEVERVQHEIESALAGITIIIETIAPWKAILVPPAASSPRAFRGGPAANLDSVHSRR
jgi:hypothetical protein